MKDTQIWLVLYGIIWKCFGPVYSFKLKLLKRTNHFENLESNEKGYRNWNTNRGKGLQTKVEKMQMDERGYKQKWNKWKWMKGVTDKNWDGKKMTIVIQNLSDRQTTIKVSYRSVSKALLTLKNIQLWNFGNFGIPEIIPKNLVT